jgi:hypothetical protein
MCADLKLRILFSSRRCLPFDFSHNSDELVLRTLRPDDPTETVGSCVRKVLRTLRPLLHGIEITAAESQRTHPNVASLPTLQNQISAAG